MSHEKEILKQEIWSSPPHSHAFFTALSFPIYQLTGKLHVKSCVDQTLIVSHLILMPLFLSKQPCKKSKLSPKKHAVENLITTKQPSQLEIGGWL